MSHVVPPDLMADALEDFVVKLEEGQYVSQRDADGNWHHDRHILIYFRNAIATLRAVAGTSAP